MINHVKVGSYLTTVRLAANVLTRLIAKLCICNNMNWAYHL